MGGVCVQRQLAPEEQNGFKEKLPESKKKATLRRVQHGVQKRIIEPLSPKISRSHPKPATTEDELILSSEATKEDIDVVSSLEDEMTPPPVYSPRMVDAADFDDDDDDDDDNDVLFYDDVTIGRPLPPKPGEKAVEEPTPASSEYTELICDNLGPLRDACDCNESHCFICRKRLADEEFERSGKCVIWIEDDESEYRPGNTLKRSTLKRYKSRKYRDNLKEGDSVKPCCICFSIPI